jgi:hypothetical protein
MRPALISMLALFASVLQTLGGETNSVLIFPADKRPGAIIFVDECLTRALTNSMTIGGLREWATNIIQQYNQRPDFRTAELSAKDIPTTLRTLQMDMPSCKFSYATAPNDYYVIGPDSDAPKITLGRNSSGRIESLSISFYDYGTEIGPESFVPKWEHMPWYSRKLADGIYLWHGYK